MKKKKKEEEEEEKVNKEESARSSRERFRFPPKVSGFRLAKNG